MRARSLCRDTSSTGGAELEARAEAMEVGMGLVDLKGFGSTEKEARVRLQSGWAG